MLNIGDIVCFKEGKNDRNVAYTKEGKVILCSHKIPVGHAKIVSVVEKPKYYIVKAQHVTYDYYKGMSYYEFLELMNTLGFKIGFDMPFVYQMHAGCGHFIPKDEHEIFAYNLDLNMVIVACTYENSSTFYQVRVYCPGLDPDEYCGQGLYASGRQNVTKFDLTFRHGSTTPLHNMIRLVQKAKDDNPESIVWGENTFVELWNCSEEFTNAWSKTIDRILLAPAEVDTIFEKCAKMQAVLAKRGKE
jgi:hypothetical protein